MLLSAARLNAILLPLVFLIGVWVGQSWLNEPQSNGQDKPRGAEIQSKLEQRTPFTGKCEVVAKSEDSRMNHFSNRLGPDPVQDIPEDMIDVIASYNKSLGESYSFQEESYSFQLGVVLENSAIEPSPQSIENDISKSLEEAGIPLEEIPSKVDDVMEMILENDQQTPEAYPCVSPDTAVSCTDGAAS
jgi:energy-coupling factor transporter ATP-binding protein EcfA2